MGVAHALTTMPHNPETDGEGLGPPEIVYRSIRLDPDYFVKSEDGSVRLSTQAFLDPDYEPSVYRHTQCVNPPSSDPPRMNLSDIVVGLSVEAIKAENVSHGEETYELYVKPEPDEINYRSQAHAVICSDRKMHRKAFDKLKQRLVRLAMDQGIDAWAIAPPSEFIDSLPPKKTN